MSFKQMQLYLLLDTVPALYMRSSYSLVCTWSPRSVVFYCIDLCSLGLVSKHVVPLLLLRKTYTTTTVVPASTDAVTHLY
jgi:hypothetical protein